MSSVANSSFSEASQAHQTLQPTLHSHVIMQLLNSFIPDLILPAAYSTFSLSDASTAVACSLTQKQI